MRRFHLSTITAFTIGSLIIISILITGGVLSFYMNKSLTFEFENRIKAEFGEVSQLLFNQFQVNNNRLKELCYDNTIRVTLMLGVKHQLREYLKKKYKRKETFFFVKSLDSGQIFKTSEKEVMPEELKRLFNSVNYTEFFMRDEKLGFVYMSSRPIYRQRNQTGTAASIYVIKEDKSILRFVNKHVGSRLVYFKKGEAWDIFTAKKIRNFRLSSEKTDDDDLFYGTVDGKKIVAINKLKTPHFYYMTDLERLESEKNRFLRFIVYSSVTVLSITLIISYFLSRLLVAPITLLSRQAIELAEGRGSDITGGVNTKITEINHLSVSLTTMVENLKKAEELKRYQQLFEEVTDPVLIIAFGGEVLKVNHIAASRFGYSHEEFENLKFTDIVSDDERDKISDILKEISYGKERVVFETGIVTPSNETIFVECHGRSIVFDGQNVTLNVIRDITDRKKAEESLKRSEERLSLALEVSLAGAWEYNVLTEKFSLDANLSNLIGYHDEGKSIEANLGSVLDPEDLERARTKFYKYTNSMKLDYTDEFAVITKDGKRRWFHNRARAVKLTKENKPELVIGTAIDITELKRVETVLRENEERYRSILDNRNIGYFEVDLNGNYTFYNDALCALLEYTKEEMNGMGYEVYTDKITSKRLKKSYLDILKTRKPLEKFQYSVETKNGNKREIETSVSLIKDTDDKITGFRGLVMDVSELKRTEKEKTALEKELRQAHKMEAIGTLAGGIAHDFNNILTGIFGFSQLVEKYIDTPKKVKKFTDEIVKGAKRASALTQQILTFSRQTEQEKQLVNIHIVLKEVIHLLRSTIPKNIEIKAKINSNSKITADPTQFHQVIMNLCTNAYHSMRESGGVLTIESYDALLPDLKRFPDVNLDPGKYLVITVHDTGSGMDSETLGKVFDPYFTTKLEGDGTGLGLAIVYGIIEDHGGAVRASSKIDAGSAFQVLLPIAHEEEIVIESIEEKEPVQEGNESILFVDDEESILLSIEEYLIDCGYSVRSFTNPVTALKEFRRNPLKFDLVITDMTMPKMTGDEFSKEIMEVRGEIPVILCTGYSDKITEETALEMGIKRYLQKPAESRKIAETVREVLDESKTSGEER